MDPVEYVFRVDAFTPDTLSMARLAEYLTALAGMIGHADHTHFLRVEPGSVRLLHKVDAMDAPKVEARLDAIRMGAGPKEAIKAYRAIEDLLANDNAVGELSELASGRVVVPFAGRNRPKALQFPPFREEAVIEGQIVSIGGRDTSAHATVQDGELFHSNITMRRDQAREMTLAGLLYGPTVRLHGNGRFERQPSGEWRMLDFRMERFEVLGDEALAETLAAVRAAAGNNLMRADARDRVAGADDR